MRRIWLMLGAGLVTSVASAQVPVAEPPPLKGTVPTYWVLMVTGEKDGQPWLKTSTPETLGGTVKGTGNFNCSYPATLRGRENDTGFEQMEVACAAGDGEVFISLRCNFRNKARAGKVPGKDWKRSDLQTLNLRKKGDPKSTITVSLRCDVDAAYAVD